MSKSQALTIDVNEQFPCLTRSPFIEATIDWQTHANKQLVPETLKTQLNQRLSDYPSIQPSYNLKVQASGYSDGTSEVEHKTQWNGFRLQNHDNNFVIQFTQTGLVVSNIEMYESWQTFSQEALRLWAIFQELAEPTIINRLGVRYINKISLQAGENPLTYLKKVPEHNFNLPLTRESFFVRDTYKVPNYPYGINWVCTEQSQVTQRFLIVDIDVFISEILELEESTLTNYLNEMRWLKNKIFFNSITDFALKNFGG
ncbi:MAG: TIGR04255 family protein [Crocosphaera sp.]|nr:TIGR04255 family protein [Crocosphaera sp.]